MTLSAQISRPSERNLHIVALLSTETGRRNAMVSSIQCLLSVVGSLGIILLFAGIPQLIYAPVVTATNVVIFLVGALLLSIMVAGNACISYRFRPDLNHVVEPLDESADAPVDDKPPNYDDLSFLDMAPPDYYSVVCDSKSVTNSVDSASVEVAPTHGNAGSRSSKSCSRENSRDSQRNSTSAVEIPSRILGLPNEFSSHPDVLDITQAPGTGAASVLQSKRSTYPNIFDTTNVSKHGHLYAPPASMTQPFILINSDTRSSSNVYESNNSKGNCRATEASNSAASSPDSERSLIHALKGSECPYPLSTTDDAALSHNSYVIAPIIGSKNRILRL